MPTLLGRYEIDRELAPRDAIGRQLAGRDTVTDREVTLRVLDVLAPVPVEQRRSAMARAEQSITGLGNVTHPGVVPVLGQAEIDGRAVLVSARWEGEPLARFGRPGSLLAIDEVVELVASAAETLDAAERAGVIHGHIRPGNLLRTRDGRIRVGDFGVASALDAAGVQGVVLEQGAGYASPEKARGGRASGRGDQFSLAAVGFELLGGAPAFPGQDAASIVYRLVHEPPCDPRQLPRPIPAALVVPLFRALLKQPEQRYRSGTEFATALRVALAGVRQEDKEETRGERRRERASDLLGRR